MLSHTEINAAKGDSGHQMKPKLTMPPDKNESAGQRMLAQYFVQWPQEATTHWSFQPMQLFRMVQETELTYFTISSQSNYDRGQQSNP